MKATITLDNGTTVTGTFTPDSPEAFKDFGPLPVPAGQVTGPTMEQPLVHYPFSAGVTALPLPVEGGKIYTLETIGGVAGYGVGTLGLRHADGSELRPDTAITNGYGYQHFQALATETVIVLVTCDHIGLARYAVSG